MKRGFSRARRYNTVYGEAPLNPPEMGGLGNWEGAGRGKGEEEVLAECESSGDVIMAYLAEHHVYDGFGLNCIQIIWCGKSGRVVKNICEEVLYVRNNL